MKKLLIFVLTTIMALSLAACSSGVSQEEYDKAIQANAELQQKYDKLLSDFTEVNQKYMDSLYQKMDDIETRDITFKAIAKSINQNCVVSILNDDFIQITIPMDGKSANEVLNDISDSSSLLASALVASKFKCCLFTVVDSNGFVMFGGSFNRDGETSVYTSDKLE